MEIATCADHLVGLTQQEQTALVRIYSRHVTPTDHPDFSYIDFSDWLQRDVTALTFDDCVVAAVPGMHIAIEVDGYAHT